LANGLTFLHKENRIKRPKKGLSLGEKLLLRADLQRCL
jgi:hypothetical protein